MKGHHNPRIRREEGAFRGSEVTLEVTLTLTLTRSVLMLPLEAF